MLGLNAWKPSTRCRMIGQVGTQSSDTAAPTRDQRRLRRDLATTRLRAQSLQPELLELPGEVRCLALQRIELVLCAGQSRLLESIGTIARTVAAELEQPAAAMAGPWMQHKHNSRNRDCICKMLWLPRCATMPRVKGGRFRRRHCQLLQTRLLPLPELRLGLSAGEAQAPVRCPPARGRRVGWLKRRVQLLIAMQGVVAAAHVAGAAREHCGRESGAVPRRAAPGRAMQAGGGTCRMRRRLRRALTTMPGQRLVVLSTREASTGPGARARLCLHACAD